MEYTYDDIITAKDILTGKVKKDDIIGKSGWFMDCIPEDMSLNVIMRIGMFSKLESINLDSSYPFRIEDSSYIFFLPEKKESAPEESYEKRQAKWIEANDIKVGDKVRVADRWNDDVSFRVFPMDSLLGKILEIRSIPHDGITLWTTPDRDNFWYWPYTMLEKVEDKPTAINEIDISVFSSLETIWEMQRSLCPRIKGYTVNDSGEFIAFDNTAGEFFVEDFNTREKAISWLNGTGTKEEDEAKDKPEYVPFDLSKEEDRAKLRGKWIKSGEREAMITAFHTLPGGEWTVDCSDFINSTADGLLRFHTFLDGSPCGKQIASK